MPEKEGSDEKKDAKAVVNRKQKQMMNQEQLDLSSVAESFGGQIIGEPVELDETPALLAIPAVKYGIPAAIGIAGAGYDYYKKMRGEKGIFPDLSGVVKGVYDKIRGVHRSKKIINPEVDKSFGDALTKNRRKIKKKFGTKDGIESGTFKYNKNKNNNQSNKNNNKKFNKKDAAIAGASGMGLQTAISTLTKGKKGKGFRLGGLPGTAHNVGRRTNPQ